MADTQEIDQDEIDTTAQKAKEIGKELGVVEDKPEEDVPDYEIQEESDERIAREREPRIDKIERKQLTNKEKRDLRKKRLAEKFNEKDSIIEQQAQQIQALAGRLNDFEGRLTNVDRTKVDEAIQQNATLYQQAERDHAAAFSEGDGAKATQAMKVMYDAQRRSEQLNNLKQQYEKQPVKQQHQTQGPDPVLVKKAKEWASKHDWYNADSGDEDSEIAKAISGTLASEGYDPKTNDFWDELDDRLLARGIGQEHEEVEVEEKPATPRKRSAPPVNGGANRGDLKGKKTITLPTNYINMLKANGIWDDPKRRNKIIADRERILKEAGN